MPCSNIVKKELLEKIKAVAYWERKKVKEVVNESLESYLKGKNIDHLMRETEEVKE